MSIRQVLLLLPESCRPGLVFLAAAVVLLKLGLWPRRKGDEPYCRRCGYNLTGASPDICPECGTARSPRMTVYGQRQRRPWLIAGGLVAVVLSAGLLFKPGHMYYYTTDFYRYKPTRFVLADMRSSDWLILNRAGREMLRRLDSSNLSSDQAEAFYRQLVQLQLRICHLASPFDRLPYEVQARTPNLPGMRIRVVDALATLDGQRLSPQCTLWKPGQQLDVAGRTHVLQAGIDPRLLTEGRHTLRCIFDVEFRRAGQTGPDGPNGAVLSRQTIAVAATADISPEAAAQVPRFAGRVFCNNRRYGPRNGATTDLGRTGRIAWGPADAAAEIAWQFLVHRDGKDIYRFERRFPVDGNTRAPEATDVAYEAIEVVVFEDEEQRITITPVNAENRH
jgi:ribosomal protein L37E